MGGSKIHFAETSWSAVLRAKSVPDLRTALDLLIRAYWKPVYSYIRRRGRPVEEAKDLTQSFFTRSLENDFLKSVSPDKGRFRTFILAALNHFLSNEQRRDQAIKRGGGTRRLDLEEAENSVFLSHEETPERAFDRDWALTLLQDALQRLRQESPDPNVEALAPFLTRGTRHYLDLARRLNCSEKEIAKRVFALRARLRLLVEAQIRATTATDEDFREEIRDISKLL